METQTISQTNDIIREFLQLPWNPVRIV